MGHDVIVKRPYGLYITPQALIEAVHLMDKDAIISSQDIARFSQVSVQVVEDIIGKRWGDPEWYQH